jgi:hypothetical protein
MQVHTGHEGDDSMPDVGFAVLGVPTFHTADGIKSSHYDLLVMYTGDSLAQVISLYYQMMRRALPSLSKYGIRSLEREIHSGCTIY